MRGRASRLALEDVDVEDTAQIVLDHDSGARSVFFATNANATDSPVTLEIVTEGAELFLRRDLTVRYADGRVEVVAERHAASSGRAYWGVSHRLLIADFYARLDDPEPFWISPREAAKSLDILSRVYASSILTCLTLGRALARRGSDPRLGADGPDGAAQPSPPSAGTVPAVGLALLRTGRPRRSR